MRLFVAIDISDDTRRQVREVAAALARRLRSPARVPRVTWVAPDAAHVTVRFIGEVSDAVAERICDALSAPLPVEPYDVEFAGLGAFPDERRPRTLWVGATGGRGETSRLESSVSERLDPIVGSSDHGRPFNLHLTLARVKEAVPFAWKDVFSSVQAGRSLTRVDHVTLYSSKTLPQGPTYTALCVTPLAGPPPVDPSGGPNA